MKSKKAKAFLGMGTLSLVVVLVIAAIACFAVLTYVSADTEYKLSQKSKESVDSYYLADAEANEKLNFLYNQQKNGKLQDMYLKKRYTVTTDIKGTMVKYSCVVDKNSNKNSNRRLQLNVEVVFNGLSPPEIYKWEVEQHAPLQNVKVKE